MKIGSDRARATVARLMEEGLACSCCTDEMKALFTKWLENREDAKLTREVADALIPLCEGCGCDVCKGIVEYKTFIYQYSITRLTRSFLTSDISLIHISF